MIENAKVLNTRIILKNDTLANWNDSTLVLQPGEVAFAKIENADNYGTPTYLMKVGDGSNRFADLKWVAANAADVYKWAKSKEIKTAGTGNGVTGVTVVNNEDGTTSVVLNKDLTFALASDLNNYTTTEALTTLLDSYVTEDELTEILKGYALVDHKHTVEDITDFDTAVKAYDYATKGEAQGYVDAKDEAIAAAKQAADDAQDDVDALALVVGEVPEDKTVVEMISDVQEAATYDDTQVKADIKANADAIDAIEVDYLKAADKTALQEQITANANAIELLTDGVDADKVDGVKDLINYVENHGPDVTKMKEDIAANTRSISEAAGTYETKTDAAAKLAEAKEYADGINTAIDERLDVLEAINHEAYIAADATLKAELQAEIDADVKVLADGAVKANADAIDAIEEELTTHGDIVTHNAAEFATVGALAATNEEVAKKANDADLATIAKTGSTDDLVQGNLVLVFDCGTSAE